MKQVARLEQKEKARTGETYLLAYRSFMEFHKEVGTHINGIWLSKNNKDCACIMDMAVIDRRFSLKAY